MRFAGMALDGGSYANAAMNSGGAMQGILAKNTPNYGKLSATSGTAQSKERVAGMNAEANLLNAGMSSLADMSASKFNAEATIAQGEAAAEASRAQGMSNMFGGLAGGFSSLGAKPKTYGAKDFDLNKSFW